MKLDNRRKYYMVLDCETATLPYAQKFEGADRQKIAIARPLIYDLGWQIIDRQGRVYDKQNYLITEIFSVPSVFNTAYYASKRPIYLDKLKKGEITLMTWNDATEKLVEAMEVCYAVGAYNSMFDFKKAIPFTETYISQLYSPNFHDWEKSQEAFCDYILANPRENRDRNFNGEVFQFRGVDYPLFDLWGMSCEHLLNNDEYRQLCDDNEWYSASGKFYKTSAEMTYRYIRKNNEFVESHTALDDAIIESEIMKEILKPTPKNLKIGITYFPFRLVGKVGAVE